MDPPSKDAISAWLELSGLNFSSANSLVQNNFHNPDTRDPQRDPNVAYLFLIVAASPPLKPTFLHRIPKIPPFLSQDYIPHSPVHALCTQVWTQATPIGIAIPLSPARAYRMGGYPSTPVINQFMTILIPSPPHIRGPCCLPDEPKGETVLPILQ